MKDLRVILVSDKEEDAGGLFARKNDDAVWH